MAPPLLTLQDVHLTFGGTPLLEGAELSIGERERVCLVGRNGSGKSTLLKIAAGTVEADRGTRFAQPGATIRYLAQEPICRALPPRSHIWRQVLRRATICIARATCSNSSASPATRPPRALPAEKRR